MEILKRRKVEISLMSRIMQLEEARVPGTGLSLSAVWPLHRDARENFRVWGPLSTHHGCVQEHDCIHLQEAFSGSQEASNPHLKEEPGAGTLILMTAGPRA